MKHYYPDVPGLGNVALSRHAQAQAEKLGLTDEAVERILSKGTDTPDGFATTWREFRGIRMVIITPAPFSGALLVKTIYRVKAQHKAR